MKAAVLNEFKEPLEFKEVPQPQLEPGDVLIKVEACGVCHSDLHVADGDWTQFARMVKKPLILGHEIAGRVVERGAAVHELQVGDRVGVPWLHWSCGECEFCREGNENLCSKQKITGVTVDGGYAEFVKAPASHAISIPDDVSSIEAAPLFCAGVTVFRALKKASVSLGHSTTLNAASNNVVKELRAKGGVHIALVTSASRAAYDMAFSCVRSTGTLLAVGLPAENICFPPIMMAAAEVRIQASAVGTRQDLREVLAMAAAGKIRCRVATRSLSEANKALDQLRTGQVSGRIVLVMP